MQLRRAVATQANQETMLLEKNGPFGVKQCAVGLQIIFDALMRLFVARLQSDHCAKEVEAEQRRFAALPGKDHLVGSLCFDELLDMPFQHLV